MNQVQMENYSNVERNNIDNYHQDHPVITAMHSKLISHQPASFYGELYNILQILLRIGM